MNYLLLCFAALMLYGIKLMSSPKTAVLGNALGAGAMLAAIAVALLEAGILTYPLLWAGLGVGTALGWVAAVKVLMIQMPQMVAALNGLGGGASALVGLVLALQGEAVGAFAHFTTGLTIAVGALTFGGSALAAAKLHGVVSQRPQELPRHAAVVTVVTVLSLASLFFAGRTAAFVQLILALVFGVLLTMRVGGADMPITISLLNSLSGVAGAIAGFPLKNPLLVAVGGIVGASGFILTQIMCRAMNRSLLSILTGRTTVTGTPSRESGLEAPTQAASACQWEQALAEAERVAIIPGYGMAVAQAQLQVKELIDLLEAGHKEVKVGIHPVAGRMPGHMNVLLAEVDVPYEKLHDMEAINEFLPGADLAIVVGANDVVNPAAMAQPGTPIYGMPIIRADLAKHVMVLNYDTQPGYAGVPNSLYEEPHVSLLLGDAKETLEKVLGFLRQPQKEVAGGRPSAEAGKFLSQAEQVIIVPGYGMALAAAQHQVRELVDVLQGRGIQVKIGIHPVAGRMPGHMNVLLAEVDIPYDMLYTLDEINPEFSSTDVVLVVGANDVVNPAAQTAEGTPIYGMPILSVSDARHVVVCNLDRSPGYAGVPNALYNMPHCLFVEGDASQTLREIISVLTEQG